MKKSLFIILMVCLAVVGLVSCKNEVEPAQEELIYVSFEKGSSRALTATLEDFDVDDFYWSYEAQKNDGSGLRSGQTVWNDTGVGSVAVQAGKGLDDTNDDPVKVPGFSKGYWNFRLFGYTDAARTKLAYWGEADSVLIDNNHHMAEVTVSPVSGAAGYLRIGTITFVPASGISVPTDLVIYTDQLFELEGTQWVLVNVQPVDGVYTLDAKQYKFTRTYSFDGIPVANGSVIATVYSNLTTTVSGTLSELTTYAEFGADQNPDIVRETWGSDIIPETSTADTVVFQKNLDPAATNKVASATMPAAAAVAKIKELEKVVGADDNTTSTLKLNLSVDTMDVKQQSVTYDIGMEAVLTYTKNLTQSVAKSDVKNVTKYVLIDINLTSDISDVTVTHSGEAMILTDDMSRAGEQGETDPKYVDVNKGTTDDPLWVGFYQLETTSTGKVLHLKTKSFSPFEVTYQMTNYVAAIGEKKYTTLATAADAAIEGQTIILLDDITFGEDYSVAVWNKAFNLDLNGHTITTNSEVGWSLSNNGYKASAICFSIENTGSQHTVVVSNGTINTRYGAGIYADGAELNLTIKNVSIHQNHESYVQTTDEYSSAVRLTSGAKVTIEGSTLEGRHAVAVSNSGGDVVINGGTVKSDLFFSTGSDSGVSKTITIKDGDFTYFSVVNDDKGTVSITGGTFDHDPTPYVPRGYKVELLENKYVVSKRTEGVASIVDGEEELFFDTLQNAIDAAYDGETIVLHADILSTEQRSSTNGSFAIKKSLTFEGKKSESENYKVYSGNGDSYRVFSIDQNANDITVTFRNMDIVGPTSGGYTRGISIWSNTGKIVVNLIGSKVSANYYSINVASGNTGGVDINITDSSCSAGWSAIQMWSKANVNCSDSILIGTNDKTYSAEGWNNYATVVSYGAAYPADPAPGTADESVLHFENCDLVGIATTGNKQWIVDYRACIETYFTNSRFWIGTTAFDGSFDDLTLVDLSTEEAFIENWQKCLVFRTNESVYSVIEIE